LTARSCRPAARGGALDADPQRPGPHGFSSDRGERRRRGDGAAPAAAPPARRAGRRGQGTRPPAPKGRQPFVGEAEVELAGGRLKVLGPGRRTATAMVRPQRATAFTAPAYSPTRQVSTSIGERVPGSGVASWVGLACSTHRHGIAPCAPACPLLRSAGRAGRAVRERRRPMAATRSPQEVFSHHAQALGAGTWTRSSPTTATTPSSSPRQASSVAGTASARHSPSSSARFRRPPGTSRPRSTRTTSCSWNGVPRAAATASRTPSTPSCSATA
jgi:hypothetical protein